MYEYNYIILSLLQNLADKISDLSVCKQAKSSTPRKARGIQPASEEKVQQMFAQLALEKKPCVQLRVEESTYANFIPLQMKTPLPKPMSSIFDSANESLSIEELISMAEDFLSNFHFTEDQRILMELLTRNQFKSILWGKHREGRITASNAHAVLHTDWSNPSKTIVQKICYPDRAAFDSNPTK